MSKTKMILQRLSLIILISAFASCGQTYNTCGDGGSGSTESSADVINIDGSYYSRELSIISIDENMDLTYESIQPVVYYDEYAVFVEMQSIGYVNTASKNKNLWLEYIIKPAYACSPIIFYETELPITSLNITSDKDYDASHPSGTLLNEYFRIYYQSSPYAKENQSIEELVLARPNMPAEFALYMTEPPETDGFYSFVATFILDNGLEFDVEFSHDLQTRIQ